MKISKVELKAAAIAVATMPVTLIVVYVMMTIWDYFIRYGTYFLTPGGSIGIRI